MNDRLTGVKWHFQHIQAICDFDKYVTVKKVKLMRKLTMLHVHCGNTYSKPLQ